MALSLNSTSSDPRTGVIRLLLVMLLAIAPLRSAAQGDILSGEQKQGTLPADTIDDWYLEARAGNHIVAVVSQTNRDRNFNIRVRIYAPSGALLDAGEVGYASQASAVAVTDGAYRIAVSDLNHNPENFDDYRLSVALVPAGSEGRSLINGANHLGSIIPGSMDIWTFDANAGDSIIVSFAKISGETAFRAGIRLYDPLGSLVDGEVTLQAEEIEHRALISGNYTVLVNDGHVDPYHSGAYRLRLARVPDFSVEVPEGDEGGHVANAATTPGAICNGRIDPGDLDIWTFTATQGDNLTVTIDELTSDSDFKPWIRLYGPTGIKLESEHAFQTHASFSKVATNTGKHTVVVANYHFGDAPTHDSYQLKVTGQRQIVYLRAIEVTQVVQDWNNSVPLVEYKRTLVRVFLQRPGPFSDAVRVRGARLVVGGNVIEQSQSNHPDKFAAVNYQFVELDVDGAGGISPVHDDRSKLNASLNFELPVYLCTGQNIDIHFEWPDGNVISSPVAPNATVQVDFTPIPPLSVTWLAVSWVDAYGAHGNNNPRLSDLHPELKAIFPVSKIDDPVAPFLWRVLPPFGGMNCSGVQDAAQLTDQIRKQHDADRAGNRIYFGILPPHNQPTLPGYGLLSGSASCGDFDPKGPSRFQHAHELSHNLGRDHALTRIIPYFGCDSILPVTGKRGPCGEIAIDQSTPFFPYTNLVNGEIKPTIGPFAGTGDSSVDRLIYGWNTADGTIVDPFKHFELMGYCRPPSRWISSHTYTNVMKTILGRFSYSQPGISAIQADYMVVSGTVKSDPGTVVFSPFYTFPAGHFPTTNQGAYTLRVFDPGGNQLQVIPFNVQSGYSDDAEVVANVSDFFSVPVQVTNTVGSITILHGTNLIASRTASPHSPVIQLLSPLGGEVFSTNEIVLNWMASDLDGETLSYMMQYSPDGGTNWQTVAMDWATNSIAVDTAWLRATSNGLMRVIASDGFNSAATQSTAPFTILNHPPRITIVRPDAEGWFTMNQSIFLEAQARDVDDGPLEGTNIVWTSSLNGLLGTGADLYLTARQLQEGAHVITATARDFHGATNSASVTIHISRQVLPLLAIEPVGTRMNLSWPGLLTNYVLQSALDLPATDWTTVTNVPVLNVLEDWAVSVNATNRSRFFRLIRQ